MPICPRCNATIHPGADDQCPACGYSLRRANAVFGDSLVEFTRVVDAAGALTHQDRMELLHTLEDLERNIVPIALCIYITDDGQAQEFRSHAHWILNHARIHHPSFGKREKMQAIEDAELTERRPGEASRSAEEQQPAGFLSRLCQKALNCACGIRNYVRDAIHPYPPPVRQEWMLILVMDVQLEMACFSWGYMLDPYINPDSINSCIIRARLQFRERAMVAGLKRVMKSAVSQIAANSHRVNKKLRKRISSGLSLLPLCLGLGLALSAPVCWAAPASSTSPQRKPAATSRTAGKPTASRSTASRSATSRSTTATSSRSSTASRSARRSSSTSAAASSTSSSSSRGSRSNTGAGKTAAPQASAPPPTPPTNPPKPSDSLQDDDLAEEVPEEEGHPTTSAGPSAPAAPSGAVPPASSETSAPSPPTSSETSSPAPSSSTQSAPAAPAPLAGAPAQYGATPRWSAEDHRRLMAGTLTSYTLLLPSGKENTARPSSSGSPGPRRGAASDKQESDTSVPGRYCPAYARPSSAGLCDPQMLLPTVERGDVERFLGQINAHSPFRIYVSLFGEKQEIPQELAATTLVTAVAQPCEYAVMLRYKLGSDPDIELGYQEIHPEDDLRHRWQLDVREAARQQGGDLPGLLAAIQKLHDSIMPLAAGFRPITPETAAKAPLIPIVLPEDTEEKKISIKEKLRLYLEDEQSHPTLIVGGCSFLAVLAVFLLFIFRRRSGHLYETQPDVRLASPYGAGVSRYVRYLEGKEARKERSLF